jgi:hypothetical protein
MLRDNLAGLIEPMIDRAGAHPLGGHSKHGPTGGCSRSTELTIVVLKRSWRPTFRWKTARQAEKAKCPGFEVTTAAHDSRAVGTALHQSHRTIDPQCLKKSPPRRGGIYALTKNVPSPFHAEPTQAAMMNSEVCRGSIRYSRMLSRSMTWDLSFAQVFSTSFWCSKSAALGGLGPFAIAHGSSRAVYGVGAASTLFDHSSAAVKSCSGVRVWSVRCHLRSR